MTIYYDLCTNCGSKNTLIDPKIKRYSYIPIPIESCDRCPVDILGHCDYCSSRAVKNGVCLDCSFDENNPINISGVCLNV